MSGAGCGPPACKPAESALVELIDMRDGGIETGLLDCPRHRRHGAMGGATERLASGPNSAGFGEPGSGALG